MSKFLGEQHKPIFEWIHMAIRKHLEGRRGYICTWGAINTGVVEENINAIKSTMRKHGVWKGRAVGVSHLSAALANKFATEASSVTSVDTA